MSRRMSCSMTLEAITGRGDPTSNRARRRPTPPAPPRSTGRGPVMSDLILALTALGYTLVGAHWLTCRRR